MLINDIVVGDGCAYDTGNVKTSALFDLFYVICSNTGYHPEPSNFNFGFTAFVGLFAGGMLSYKLVWKNFEVNTK